jgi:lysozyme
MMDKKLRGDLIRHEGLRLKPYRCSAGKLTIGVGRNLEDVGITSDEAFTLLDNDIARLKVEIHAIIPNFNEHNEVRQRVLLNMAFNLGLPGLSKFSKTLAAVKAKDYVAAASEMLNSRWAQQVGRRALELSRWMRTGVDNETGG